MSSQIHPVWPGLIAYIAAGSIIACSASLGAFFGWSLGAAHHVALGAVFAFAALAGEALKPFAVTAIANAIGRRHWGTAFAAFVLASVAVIYSITAELSLSSQLRGDAIAARQTAASGSRIAAARLERARSELATLPPPAKSPDEIDALIAGKLARPGIGECLTIDGPLTRAHCPAVIELRAERARANRYQTAMGELRTAEAARLAPAAPDTGGAADPLAASLAAYAGALGIQVTADALSPWLALVPVLFLEAGSALGLLIAREVAMPRRDTRSNPLDSPSGLTAGSVASPALASVPAPIATSPAPETSFIAALRGRGVNGTVTGNQRDLSRELGISAAKFNRLLKSAEAAGVLTIQVARTGTAIHFKQ